MTKEIVEQTLIKNNYNKTLTAKELEISRSTLWRILKESSGL
ncbi:helix-turn-helix domain-containing protein [Liquorilactobacillus sp.]